MKNKRLLAPLAALAALGLTACASGTQKVELTRSQSVPAASGIVEARKTDNNNTEVNLQVSNLAPAYRVSPTADSYVVWLRPTDEVAPPQNMGALKVDTQNLSGSLTTVTPYRQFELFVTAEPSATAQSPQGPRVLQGTIARTG